MSRVSEQWNWGILGDIGTGAANGFIAGAALGGFSSAIANPIACYNGASFAEIFYHSTALTGVGAIGGAFAGAFIGFGAGVYQRGINYLQNGASEQILSTMGTIKDATTGAGIGLVSTALYNVYAAGYPDEGTDTQLSHDLNRMLAGAVGGAIVGAGASGAQKIKEYCGSSQYGNPSSWADYLLGRGGNEAEITK